MSERKRRFNSFYSYIFFFKSIIQRYYTTNRSLNKLKERLKVKKMEKKNKESNKTKGIYLSYIHIFTCRKISEKNSI